MSMGLVGSELRRVRGDGQDVLPELLVGVEPRLRRALVAAYGPQAGLEATADALAWGWEHLDRLEQVDNRAGYLWRVAQTSLRRQRRRANFEVPAGVVARSGDGAGDVDDGMWDSALVGALRKLSLHQRVAVVLVDAYQYQLSEASDVLGCSISTLRNHLARGRASLRARLEDAR